MNRRVVSKTPQARLDLIEAGLYIAEGNPDAADRFHHALNKIFQRLLQHPQLGRARPELGRDIRSLPHRQYVIYYRRQPAVSSWSACSTAHATLHHSSTKTCKPFRQP